MSNQIDVYPVQCGAITHLCYVVGGSARQICNGNYPIVIDVEEMLVNGGYLTSKGCIECRNTLEADALATQRLNVTTKEDIDEKFRQRFMEVYHGTG